VGEAAAISAVSYLLYVAASLILYQIMPLRVGAAIASVTLLTTAYYLVWRTAGRPASYVRFHGLSFRVGLYSVLASLALVPLAASVMAVVLSRVDLPEEWLESAYELIRAEDLPGLLYSWLVAAVLAAVGEEFIFRGVIQNSLSVKYPQWVAVTIASFVFGVLHVWRFPAAFMLGAFLGTLYAVTGTLAAPMIGHITINSVVVIGSFALERAAPESLPDWIAQDMVAPAAVLAASVLAFTIFMGLIWRTCPRTFNRGPKHASNAGGQGVP
jgi:membrane protease YdiL (CAAX protease family)